MRLIERFRRKARALLAGSVALSIVLAACGGGTKATGGVRGAGAESAAVSSSGSSSGSSGSPGSLSPSAIGSGPAASSEDENRRCIGVRFVSPHRGEGGQPHIWTRPDRVDGWGCGNIVAGRICNIGWSGSFAGADAENYIRFVAWERGKHSPVLTTDVGPLPLEGQFTSTATKFTYRVGKTDQVRFYLQLLNSQKIPTATSDTFVYHVGCKG